MAPKTYYQSDEERALAKQKSQRLYAIKKKSMRKFKHVLKQLLLVVPKVKPLKT